VANWNWISEERGEEEDREGTVSHTSAAVAGAGLSLGREATDAPSLPAHG
jgi:hypothetical protein